MNIAASDPRTHREACEDQHQHAEFASARPEVAHGEGSSFVVRVCEVGFASSSQLEATISGKMIKLNGMVNDL